MGDGIHASTAVEITVSKKSESEKAKDDLQDDEHLVTEFEDKLDDVVDDTDDDEKFSQFRDRTRWDGFELLQSLECHSSHGCEEEEVEGNNCNGVEEVAVVSSAGKRNRQDSSNSCNSGSNDVTRKVNKKSRKKHSKKQELDDEIEKIMADIEMKKEDVLSKLKSDTSLAEKAESVSNPSNEKVLKKKKKKNNKNRSLLSVSAVSVASTKIQNGDADKLVSKPNDKSKTNGSETSKIKPVSQEEGSEELFADGLSADEKGDDFKKDRKGPGKKQLAFIQAALKKAKEEEEKQRQETLAKQKRAEEAERLRLEQLKLEEERKLKKKQKEKEKRERLKAQGKILTKAQKLARIRTEASISFWREQAGNVPRNGEKKLFPDGKKKHDGGSCNSEDDLLSPHDSALPNLEIIESSVDVPPDSEWKKKSQHSLQMRSMSESCSSEVGGSSNTELNRRFQSDVSLHTSDPNAARNGPLTQSQSLHHITDTSKSRGQKFMNGNHTKPYSSKFRSPVVCVLGHVDTGKTKLLDNIRKSHVQASEAGGITQQIGATMVPQGTLKDKCNMVTHFSDFDLQLPGLLIIDTPGHESFRNLRSRGSTLCDIAILVVDIMHGLEPQTIESINLLKDRKTPFVVALNKVDRIYGWQPSSEEDIRDVIKKQSVSARMEFDKRFKEIILQFTNESMNVALFYENQDPRTYVSVVPVSAISGDGMGNMLALVCQLTQNMMSKRLLFSEELEAIVLEVKMTAGLGTTLDVILVNGRLKEGDTIVLAGQDGPVVSQIRSLLMPQPLKELRVKNPYVEYKEVKGAQGVKVSGRDLDKVIAGLPLYVAKCPDQVVSLKKNVTSLFCCAMNSLRLSERGVYVQASTLGSLEALLEFLKTSEIPYAGVKVGPVVKKDVIKASVMLEHDVLYAVILAFDVKIEKDAQEYAEHLGIKIFQADIIYHLFDNFMDYREKLLEKKKNEAKKLAVFPCKLRVLPDYVFSIRDPIVLGIRVEAGVLKVGTPICVPSRNSVFLGCVASIEIQHQEVQSAKNGDEACVRIEPVGDECPKVYGKHFDHEDILVSRISRQTIDVCKEFYRKDLAKSDWQLMVELKHLLCIA